MHTLTTFRWRLHTYGKISLFDEMVSFPSHVISVALTMFRVTAGITSNTFMIMLVALLIWEIVSVTCQSCGHEFYQIRQLLQDSLDDHRIAADGRGGKMQLWSAPSTVANFLEIKCHRSKEQIASFTYSSH